MFRLKEDGDWLSFHSNRSVVIISDHMILNVFN